MYAFILFGVCCVGVSVLIPFRSSLRWLLQCDILFLSFFCLFLSFLSPPSPPHPSALKARHQCAGCDLGSASDKQECDACEKKLPRLVGSVVPEDQDGGFGYLETVAVRSPLLASSFFDLFWFVVSL